MQSPQAYIAGQAGPDNPQRISAYTGANTMAATSLLLTTAPDTGPPKEVGGVATSPSVVPDTRIDPSTTAAGPAASPSIGLEPRPVTPDLCAGGDSVPSSPSHSTSRSPSPDAEELISSLANYESLSDDALHIAALRAQQAMVKWQDEFIFLQHEPSRTRESPYTHKKLKANPRKLENPAEYDRKHHESLQQLRPNTVQTTGNNTPQSTAKPRATKSTTGPGPRDELHIDMNEPMQPVDGKRIRKPRVMHDDTAAAVSAPRKSTKRTRQPDTHDAHTPPIDQQPAAKKQDTRARSFTPPPWVRTSRNNIKPEAKDPSAGPENVPEKKQRELASKVASKPQVKTEPVGGSRGKDPVRAAAARLMWKRRQASGTNGRRGGAPKGGTVVKAVGEEGGEVAGGKEGLEGRTGA